MKLIKNRKQDGFTMIEIMVVVVIVAILAAIAIPTYVEYVKGAYASEAKTVIGNIENAAKMYYQTYGEWPSDVEELERNGQLEVDRSTRMKWSFALSLSDDGGQISAESTEEMKGGPGKMVVYDRARGVYTGYGSYDRYRETRSVKNNVKISVGKINQYFGASGSVDLNNRNQVMDFKLNKAGYSISGVTASFIVNRSSKSTFNISDFKTEAKNIDIEFDSYNEIPTLEKASFEISLSFLSKLIFRLASKLDPISLLALFSSILILQTLFMRCWMTQESMRLASTLKVFLTLSRLILQLKGRL